MPSPILVLGSGQRCGSTLVQRLLSSHPEVMIWGEFNGELRKLVELTDVMHAWHGAAASEIQRDGHQTWMATVLPEGQLIDDAARSFIFTLFGAPAATNGCPRWGFKEVCLDLEHAAWLRTLFPDLRVVHITRDPRDVIASLDFWERRVAHWDRAQTEMALDDWVRINTSFATPGDTPPWVRSWRYEEMIAQPDAFVRSVAELLDVDGRRFQHSVFEHRIAGGGPMQRDLRRFEELPLDLRGLLDDDRVRKAARAYGYALKT